MQLHPDGALIPISGGSMCRGGGEGTDVLYRGDQSVYRMDQHSRASLDCGSRPREQFVCAAVSTFYDQLIVLEQSKKDPPSALHLSVFIQRFSCRLSRRTLV